MGTKKKQNQKGRNNKNFIIIMLAAALISVAVYTSMGNARKQQAASADTAKPPVVVESKSEVPVLSGDVPSDVDLKILKSEVSEKAVFYPYKAGETYMEVIAVKATDGSIRTALNTCQICFSSGQGYYKQEGDKLVCQNCGNRFGVDDVEVVRGGCNPVPIMKENKTDDGENIVINKDFLEANKELFVSWKR